MTAGIVITTERDVYANLLRDSRGLRRDQATQRDLWFEALPWEKKEQTLFELEMILKGIACFGNPRNHPGRPRGAATVGHDFLEELRILRDGIARVNTLVKTMLGDRERAYTFGRYLQSVLPEDSARGRLLQEQLTQDTPDESLFVLRNSFGSFQDLIDGVLRLDHISNRLYGGLHGTVAREIGRNAYFNPLLALEFRPEFDRIRTPEVLEALDGVENEAAHRLLALTMLSLFRALRYLALIDEYAAQPASARRAYLMFAVLRSDLRALTRYLHRHAGKVIAKGLERDILSVHAVEIVSRRDALAKEAEHLKSVRSALETVAGGLRVDVRKVFVRDLPAPNEGIGGGDLGPQLVMAAAVLRASVQHAVVTLCRSLVAGLPPPQLATDVAARRAASDRLRREIWMFMQILRAFIAKAQASDAGTDEWSANQSFQFVRDFLGHFRAIGYQLLRANDYGRLDVFLESLSDLRDVDLLDRAQLELAVSEAHRFYEYLEQLFKRISTRAELKDLPFDRKDATETLKIYLGRA